MYLDAVVVKCGDLALVPGIVKVSVGAGLALRNGLFKGLLSRFSWIKSSATFAYFRPASAVPRKSGSFITAISPFSDTVGRTSS